jgi:hypothetical protein
VPNGKTAYTLLAEPHSTAIPKLRHVASKKKPYVTLWPYPRVKTGPKQHFEVEYAFPYNVKLLNPYKFKLTLL